MSRISDGELIAELQRLADEFGRTPRAKDMREQGKFSAATCGDRFGSWNEALEAAGFEPTKKATVPTDDLLAELHRLADALDKTPTGEDMKEQGEYGQSVYQKRFGSWNAALEAAGFDPNREHNISETELIDELHRVADELGRTPRQGDLSGYSRFSSRPYTIHFGSWNGALEAAGYEPTNRQDITDEELLDEIHRLADELGRTPTRKDMNDMGEFSRGPYDTHFGSWNAALEAAGLTPNNRVNISEAELIDELQRLATELDRTPMIEDMREAGKFSKDPFTRVFGSWSAALEAAGLAPTRYRRLPDAELIADLEQASDALGKSPTKDVFREWGGERCSPSTYERRFGSWNDALREAGLSLNCWIDIPEERLIAEIHRLADEFGRPPVYEELEQYCEFSGRTYENRFGSWTEALEAAGLEPNLPPLTTRSDAGQHMIPDTALLDELRDLHAELDRVPRQRDMEEFGEFGAAVYHRRFGTWNEALEAVGLDPNKVHQIPEEDLIADLQRLADELGQTPRELDNLNHGKYSFTTFRARFGSWNDALRAAGFDPTKLQGEGAIASLYLAIRRSLPGESWNAVRKDVYATGRKECAIESCDFDATSTSSLHAHHIIPVLAGGTNDPELSIPLCGPCHRHVEAYTATICDRHIAEIAREEGEWKLGEATEEKRRAGDQVSLTFFT